MSKGKILTTLVAVSALVLTSAVTPAAARWGGGWHGGGWRGAGIAAGIGAGLALGAAAAYGGYGFARLGGTRSCAGSAAMPIARPWCSSPSIPSATRRRAAALAAVGGERLQRNATRSRSRSEPGRG